MGGGSEGVLEKQTWTLADIIYCRSFSGGSVNQSIGHSMNPSPQREGSEAASETKKRNTQAQIKFLCVVMLGCYVLNGVA